MPFSLIADFLGWALAFWALPDGCVALGWRHQDLVSLYGRILRGALGGKGWMEGGFFNMLSNVFVVLVSTLVRVELLVGRIHHRPC